MYFTNQAGRSKERPAGRPICSEVMISGEWLAVCILPPNHQHPSNGGGRCLPSPYLGRP